MPSTPIPSTPIPSTPVNIFLLYFVFIFSEKCNFFFSAGEGTRRVPYDPNPFSMEDPRRKPSAGGACSGLSPWGLAPRGACSGPLRGPRRGAPAAGTRLFLTRVRTFATCSGPISIAAARLRYHQLLSSDNISPDHSQLLSMTYVIINDNMLQFVMCGSKHLYVEPP